MYANRFYTQGPLGTAQALTSTTDISEFLMPESALVEGLEFTISTTVSSSQSVVLTFYYRPTVKSSSNQVSMGTITIPTGAAAGKTYVNLITPVKVRQGSSVCCSVTTDSSSAGAGYAALKLSLNPEVEANDSNVVVVSA